MSHAFHLQTWASHSTVDFSKLKFRKLGKDKQASVELLVEKAQLLLLQCRLSERQATFIAKLLLVAAPRSTTHRCGCRCLPAIEMVQTRPIHAGRPSSGGRVHFGPSGKEPSSLMISDLPVISGGCGRPRSCRIVGAISASLPDRTLCSTPLPE